MTSNSPVRHIQDSDIAVCGVALACTALALINANFAMAVGCIGIPLGLLWLARLLLDKKRRSRGLRALTYTSVIAMMVAGPTACSIHTTLVERDVQPLIEALDQHFTQHGQYPAKLSELSSAPAVFCEGWKSRPPFYGTNGTEAFWLACPTFGMNKHVYESKTKSWRDRD